MAPDNTKKENNEVFENANDNIVTEWPQILAVFVASLTSLSSSNLFSWTSPTIPILIADDKLGINIEMASYLTVIPPVASILAAPVYGLVLDRVGRKWCLISAGFLHIAAWLCVMFSTSLYVFYLSRAFFGFADASLFGVLPVYISEVTTPKVRGRWGNLMGFFMYFGQVVMNTVGHFFSIKTSAYILVCLPILFLIVFTFMPETPYYYLMKEQHENAEKSLKWLRNLKNVDKEFIQLTSDVKRQLSETGSYMDCIKIKSNRTAILIVALGRAMQQLSGVSAFAVYNQYIFQEAGTSLDKGYSSMIYAWILSITNFLALLFTDKLGRKKPMTISCTCSFIFLTAEAIYFFLKDTYLVDVSAISWFPILGMVLYIVAFSSGLGLIPILLLSEMFSTSIRSKASTIMTILFGIYLIASTKLFQLLASNYGLGTPFAVFSICTFGSIFLSYFFIPETKGKTLEEIQQMLKGVKDDRASSQS
ncbi:hypothetical protein Trydic_g4145 [Trypoxylus dichotomus]